MQDWSGKEIITAQSNGGVNVVADPFNNLISTGIVPWPPSEIAQKLYQSRQIRAFSDDIKGVITQRLKYYSDLQSLHSEDAITWSVFGTVGHAHADIRNKWIADFLTVCGLSPTSNFRESEISLWRRIPHPDTLVSGGPEIDFEIITDDTIVLGESKWLSQVAASQGKMKNKDQIQLRVEFLRKYGRQIYCNARQFIVICLGLSPLPTSMSDYNDQADVKVVGTTWDKVVFILSHPLHDELKRYFDWKLKHSKTGN